MAEVEAMSVGGTMEAVGGMGIMVRDLLMPMLPLSRMPIDMDDMAMGTGAIVDTVDTVITAKEMLILSPTEDTVTLDTEDTVDIVDIMVDMDIIVDKIVD